MAAIIVMAALYLENHS
ncbi:hypothetical protein [Escherichia coli]